MTNQILNLIEQHKLLPDSCTVILGLSGGPDSVFLLNLLAPLHKEKMIQLVAAHLDHEWRADSAKDVAFCRKTAEGYGVPFVSAKASDLLVNFKRDGSQEALGRRLRRTFLENVAHSYNAQVIALGHHLQDQEETFFIRLIRGTSLSGLVGMRPKHGVYIRPLLETNKEDILAYLHEKNIAYLNDPTNTSSLYLRNRIRNNVIPELQAADKRFNQNFLKTISSLQDTEKFLTTLTQQYFEDITTIIDGKQHLDLKKFFCFDVYLQKRLLVHWLILEGVPFTLTDSFLNEMIRFLESKEGGEHNLHERWKLIKYKNFASVGIKRSNDEDSSTGRRQFETVGH
jgi:tRNA(Ile)-lysidine synthase